MSRIRETLSKISVCGSSASLLDLSFEAVVFCCSGMLRHGNHKDYKKEKKYKSLDEKVETK